MIANIVSAISAIVGAIGSLLTPTASTSEGALISSAAVTAIGALFAVPVAIVAGRKAIGLVKSIRG